MRITHTVDSGAVTITIELGSDVDPDRAADIVWGAVSRILTEHRAAASRPQSE